MPDIQTERHHKTFDIILSFKNWMSLNIHSKCKRAIHPRQEPAVFNIFHSNLCHLVSPFHSRHLHRRQMIGSFHQIHSTSTNKKTQKMQKKHKQSQTK